MPLGRQVVMIGGGLVAVELAEFLAERGRQVTVLEEGDVIGQGLMLVRRWRNLADCRDKGVEFLTRTRVVNITKQTLTYCNANQQERTIDADQVIITSGAEGDLGLADRLRSDGLTVHSIGDCNGVTYIDGAIHAGFDLAQTL
jgi:pyruvate/2-oxoglutarate dehydrogenase complex dihydrolipoamide dehydrogenase (E3) component